MKNLEDGSFLAIALVATLVASEIIFDNRSQDDGDDFDDVFGSMSRSITLAPAYGRDYSSKKAVEQAWKSGKDFLIMDFEHPYSGKPTNISQARQDGINSATIRYGKMRKVAVIKF